MKKKIIAALVMLLVVICSAKAIVFAQDGYINVSLSKTREIPPNKAEIVISVETSNKSAKIASDENKKISNIVQANIKTLINESNGDYIKTSNFRLSPRSIYKDGKSIFDKYVALNSITVYTKNLDNVTKIIDMAIATGATNVSNLSFSASDYDEVCTQMIVDLVAKSKLQASKMVAPAGAKIKGVRSLDTNCSLEGEYPRVMYYSMNKMSDAAVSAGEGTPIQQGKVKLNASVNASFFVK